MTDTLLEGRVNYGNLLNACCEMLPCDRLLIIAANYRGFGDFGISEFVGIQRTSIHHHFATEVELYRRLSVSAGNKPWRRRPAAAMAEWPAPQNLQLTQHQSLALSVSIKMEFTMKKHVVACSTLLAIVLSLNVSAAEKAPDNGTIAGLGVKNIVLVHGLYADGSSWAKVIPLLQAKGYQVTAVQNPTTSLEADVDAVKRTLALQDGPTILVAHSYGGMVISQAGVDPKVKGLVYVAARAPEAGEDYPALAAKFPPAPAAKGLQWSADGFGVLSQQAFLQDFAGDLPKQEANVFFSVQQPFAKAIATAKTDAAAWQSKPSWYAVSTQDRTINPELQRFMAKRMNAHTIELAASHVSLISHPREIADLIEEAASEADRH